MSESEELNVWRKPLVQTPEVELALIAIDGQVTDPNADPLRQQLPGDNIAVVLHLGEQNLIAGLQVRGRPGLGHEVDAFGCAAREDDFVRRSSMDELSGALPCGLEGRSRAVAELVDTAMHVRIVVLVVMAQSIQHAEGLLTRSRIVQIDQGMSVDFLIENRKVSPESGPIW